MHPRTYNLISRLALEYKDPTEVKRLMINYVVSNIDHLKSTIVRNMLEEYVKNRVSFNDVYNAARNLTTHIKPEKARLKSQARIEKSTMIEKLVDARKQEKYSKFLMIKSKQLMSKLVRVGTYTRKLLMKQLSAECEKLWVEENRRVKKKIERS